MCGGTGSFFSEGTYAGATATVAGVLAAVIVAAIALRLGNPPPLERFLRDKGRQAAPSIRADLSRPLLIMPVALVAAFLSAYSYGIIAGSQSNPVVATELVLPAGGQLALAAVLTVFCIAWLLRDYETHEHAVVNVALLIGLLVGVAIVYLVTAVTDQAGAQGHCLSGGEWAAAITPISLPPFLAAVIHLKRFLKGADSHPTWATPLLVQGLMLLAIGVVVFGSALSAVYDDPSHGGIPVTFDFAYYGLLGLIFGGVLLTLPYPSQCLTARTYDSSLRASGSLVGTPPMPEEVPVPPRRSQQSRLTRATVVGRLRDYLPRTHLLLLGIVKAATVFQAFEVVTTMVANPGALNPRVVPFVVVAGLAVFTTTTGTIVGLLVDRGQPSWGDLVIPVIIGAAEYAMLALPVRASATVLGISWTAMFTVWSFSCAVLLVVVRRRQRNTIFSDLQVQEAATDAGRRLMTATRMAVLCAAFGAAACLLLVALPASRAWAWIVPLCAAIVLVGANIQHHEDRRRLFDAFPECTDQHEAAPQGAPIVGPAPATETLPSRSE